MDAEHTAESRAADAAFDEALNSGLPEVVAPKTLRERRIERLMNTKTLHLVTAILLLHALARSTQICS